MAMRILEPTDLIEVKFVPILIFGPPGCGKTSLAQTAANPLTLDFDAGIHRCANRRRAAQFDAWNDCVKAGEDGAFADYQTLVIDTGGRALDKMIPAILAESAKNGWAGNLTPQGWGVLGSRFTTWMKTVASWGKDVVMICHEAEATNAGGNPYFLPDLPGKMSYKEVHKSFDLIGRIRHEGKRRLLDFSPSENSVGKNAAGWEPIVLPDLHKHPAFLADLIKDAKARIGKTAEQSAAVAAKVAEWVAWLARCSDVDVFNKALPDIALLTGSAREQVRELCIRHAKAKLWAWDKEAKTYRAEQPKEAVA